MTDPRIIFMGAPETAAADFEVRTRADVPGIDLLPSGEDGSSLPTIQGNA